MIFEWKESYLSHPPYDPWAPSPALRPLACQSGGKSLNVLLQRKYHHLFPYSSIGGWIPYLAYRPGYEGERVPRQGSGVLPEEEKRTNNWTKITGAETCFVSERRPQQSRSLLNKSMGKEELGCGEERDQILISFSPISPFFLHSPFQPPHPPPLPPFAAPNEKDGRERCN